MDHFYGLTYLLFKHGTLAHRRQNVVFNEVVWRTAFTFLNQAFFFAVNGYSATMPYSLVFYSAFMSFLTPAQYLIEGIFATDYGYAVLHRIIGEYKQNHQYGRLDFSVLMVMLSAGLDCALFNLVYIGHYLGVEDLLLGPSHGKGLS